MPDPLAHVGPSDNYWTGYNAALGLGAYDCPYKPGTFEASEWDEGYLDGLADIAAFNEYSETVH